jgi:hypothetical protein
MSSPAPFNMTSHKIRTFLHLIYINNVLFKIYYYLDPIDMPLGVKVEHIIILTLWMSNIKMFPYINLHLMFYFSI